MIAEVCDHVAVMYLGRVVEFGAIKQIFGNPLHPYTQALMRSIPVIGQSVNELEVIKGNVPRPIDLPEQCGFCGRCPEQIDGLCDQSVPHFGEVATWSLRRMFSLSARKLIRCFMMNDAVETAGGSKNILLRVGNLKKYFPIETGFRRRVSGYVRAVDDVSFDIHYGETLGLVGESGSGKTTTGRCIIGAYPVTGGAIYLRPEVDLDEMVELTKLKKRDRRRYQPRMNMIFQDPYSSLDPRWTVLNIVSELMRHSKKYTKEEMDTRVGELVRMVGLDEIPD